LEEEVTCFDPKRFDKLTAGEWLDLDKEVANEIQRIGFPDRGDALDVGYSTYHFCSKGAYQPKCPWYESKHSTGSDYNGDLGNRSNYEVLLEMCEDADQDPSVVPDHCRPFFVIMSGGYNTFAIALHAERTPDDIFDAVYNMENHGILDEDHWTNLEFEAENEAWENWAEGDYRRALENALNKVLYDLAEENDIDLDDEFNLDNVDLSGHFHHWAEVAGEYWETEGQDRIIDVDAIAQRAADELVSNPDEVIPAGVKLPEIPKGWLRWKPDPRQKTFPYGDPRKATAPRAEGDRLFDFFFGKGRGKRRGLNGLPSWDRRRRR
jgi:hypothetical protein